MATQLWQGIVAFVLFATVGAQTAYADVSCDDAMSTAAMRSCLAEQYETLDKELTCIYRQVLSGIDESRLARFEDAQQAWIEFREKNAEFEASEVEDGTMYPLIYLSALVAATEQRIEELEAILHSLE